MTARDLVELVAAAHAAGLRVILDIIFNHSGSNWLYPPDMPGGPASSRITPRALPVRRLARRRTAQPVAQMPSGPKTASGRWSCRTSSYTRAGAGTSARATSTTRTPSTSAPTSWTCATFASSAGGRSPTSRAATSTGSR